MGPDLVVVGGVCLEDPTQARLAEHNNVVQTLAPDRADHPLGVSVLPGRARPAHRVLGHGRLTDLDTELQQLAVDARRTSKRVADPHLRESEFFCMASDTKHLP